MSQAESDPSVTGPYTDAEFDEHFRRSLRSDGLYVANRLVVIAVVYWLTARAIRVHDLGAGFLLLPLAVEFVSMMWVGLALRFTVVDCEAFAKTTKPGLVVFWTLLVAGIVSSVLAKDGDTFEIARIVPGWQEGWQTVLDTGLIWAFGIELLSLVASTVPEVVRWRRVGGRFLWTSIFDLSLRLAGAILLAFVAFFLLVILSDVAGDWLLGTPRRAAWFVWGFLLSIELAGLTIGVKMHGELVQKERRGGEGKAKPAATRIGATS